MQRVFSLCLLLSILLCPALSHTDDVANNGIEDSDLRCEGFSVTKDGYVVGSIINTSSNVRPAVRIDVWATDINDTRIFWRKSLNIGDMAPKAKFTIKEPYSKDIDLTLPAKFSFKLSNTRTGK